MSHDENAYADPMTFNPDRFLGPKPEPDPMDFVFGFGRYSIIRYVDSMTN
jgi:cytochrome P450